jgi:hypothetical protein
MNKLRDNFVVPPESVSKMLGHKSRPLQKANLINFTFWSSLFFSYNIDYAIFFLF